MTSRGAQRGFVYLASASPRRAALLRQLGLEFDVVPVEIDESVRPGEAPHAYVERLAMDKARAARAAGVRAGAPIVAADTAVVLDDVILGKPRDRAHAAAMLERLSGRRHAVLTAVAVVEAAREAVALSRSTVSFRALEPAEISAYWDSGEPAGKAGGYAIQGLGAVFVEQLDGSYSGVVGLPLFETARLLDAFGYRLLA